jgi:hypothetical protein
MDEEVWSYRPAPTIVYNWLLNHCEFLVDLRHKLDRDLKFAFRMGCDIFLGNCRDVPALEAASRRVGVD